MLKDNFCSSPWFHVRINPAGYYVECRWFASTAVTDYHIENMSISEYMNSQTMRQLRMDLLNGHRISDCELCYEQDEFNKVSGRQKQLLKSAIKLEYFDKSLASSPHYSLFEHSYNNQGHTNYLPVDLQIDLGNTCNSACIMCSPSYSTKLATDYIKFNPVAPDLFPKFPSFKNWPDNPTLVDKFVNELGEIPNIKYIHFLGGETLYLKSFYNICNRLIENGLSKEITIGTTTNCTVYNSELENIIKNFKSVHLGLSVETLTTLNDYIRWPSKIAEVTDHLLNFKRLRDENPDIHLTLRITPTVFSIFHIDSIFEFMLENSISAESCNLLDKPTWMRINILPKDLSVIILKKIQTIIDRYNLVPNNTMIINRRQHSLVNPVIVDIIFEYKKVLEEYVYPDNVEEERINLVRFIKIFEESRNNKILDYLPEYEEFLRSYGY